MLSKGNEYLTFLKKIKEKIHTAQYRATSAAYVEMTKLYWEIGNDINSKRAWGTEFVKSLAKDIKLTFPLATGFSERNLRYMAKFARIFSSNDLIEDVLGRITWYHNRTLMDKCENTNDYLWYASETIRHGWSGDVLVHMVESKLYDRQTLAEKTTNYDLRLPSPQSELAIQTIKDEYYFNFIPQKDDQSERDIEDKLINNITKVLLELGSGFTYAGRQKHLVVDDVDYYIDLLFFNYVLNCFIVIELKTKPFRPEFAGKLNFYVSAVDEIIKMEQHKPTIGLLLCKSKKNTTVEYTLKDLNRPIGVSAYELGKDIPREIDRILPAPGAIIARIETLDEIDTKIVKPLTKSEQRIMDLLKKDGTLSSADIADVIGHTSRSVRGLLRSLKDKGLIVRVGSDKAGFWVVVKQ